ncbi:tetratricopeptide repeat-containing sensor histidine kinase [Daejeonella oryzae]|uniref:tetratricopeptide repeat-containing sensor histidine kinase n=1 Tax=Daejeonella oryzae TaxID=1122943 RepID=UPI000423C73C|nr:ATP-binding protein [Daejeonella oryzae]
MAYKKVFTFLFGLFWINISPVFSQEQKIADSLAYIYQQKTLTDTAELELLLNLSFNELRDLNKGLKYAEELISLAKQSENSNYLRRGYFLKGTKERSLGKLEEALSAYFMSAEIARKSKHLGAEGESYGAIADVYSVGNNHVNAINYYNKAISILRQTKDSISLASSLLNAGDELLKTKKYDIALKHLQEAKLIFNKFNYESGQGYSLGGLGMLYASIGKNSLAEKNINDAIRILEKAQDYYPICDYLISMADIYSNKGVNQIALNYALRSFHLAEQYGLKEQIEKASLKLSELYEKDGDITESYKYYKKHIAYRDSIHNIQTVRQMADLRTNYEVSQKQAEVNMLNRQKQNERYLIIAMGIILGLTIFIIATLLKSNQHKRKAYRILHLQKKETEKQKLKAEDALAELQVTQKQLIQAAKMASLGELTAGIAHEIQNPLNFVNNFAEVTVELLGELREGVMNKLKASDNAEAEEIINNLENNLKKISDHGKRADSIVKGMLQHSRSSTGKKEFTDINALADEYLRLSYHGLRAKDKEFNSSFNTDFDQSIGKLDILPQDIGRVLLNLFNNAFYSVNEKKKQLNGDFEPLVTVTTKRVGSKIELSVKDNGSGIAQKSLEKIFQPFFTTKPTGQGTGLGLSLSYDIIKAHGGELKVETKEGEFAEFIIQLPISNHKKG